QLHPLPPHPPNPTPHSFPTRRSSDLEAHGKGMAVQFNYLIDKGAFVYRNGTWEVDFGKVKGAVRDLAHDLLTIEATGDYAGAKRSEEHTSELQSLAYLVCRLLLEKKK